MGPSASRSSARAGRRRPLYCVSPSSSRQPPYLSQAGRLKAPFHLPGAERDLYQSRERGVNQGQTRWELSLSSTLEAQPRACRPLVLLLPACTICTRSGKPACTIHTATGFNILSFAFAPALQWKRKLEPLCLPVYPQQVSATAHASAKSCLSAFTASFTLGAEKQLPPDRVPAHRGSLPTASRSCSGTRPCLSWQCTGAWFSLKSSWRWSGDQREGRQPAGHEGEGAQASHLKHQEPGRGGILPTPATWGTCACCTESAALVAGVVVQGRKELFSLGRRDGRETRERFAAGSRAAAQNDNPSTARKQPGIRKALWQGLTGRPDWSLPPSPRLVLWLLPWAESSARK